MSDVLDRLKAALADSYTIESELGRGGMAVVYLAKDLRHRRKVAVKVLRPEVTSAVGEDRFLREIDIAAHLTHPHILPLHDSGETDGFLYYVMPYVEGETLRDRLGREKQLSIDDAKRIAREVADALSYAHSQNLLHRDIKPENILFEADHAVVSDFGIAKAVSEAVGDTLTQTGVTVGTPAYMSPEQASGDEIDERSDIYSLGCVLYEMLAGQPPFVGPNARAIFARHLMESVPPVRIIRPDVPAHMARAVTKSLAKAPADRFATVEEFAGALVALGAETPTAVKSIAVLPFANMSGNPEDEFFSDGITEEIIDALTRISGLGVVSRTSVFAYKGKSEDVRTIGHRLNVTAVLEGSVRRAGEKLRITAQLVSVEDGYHLWSEKYNRELEDVFAIQDEIAENITRALRVILSEDEKRAISKVPTVDVRAYEFYLRGRQFFHQVRKKSLEFAREMFNHAIEIDPTYALAYAGVADANSLLHMYYSTTEKTLGLAAEASHKALELDPDLPEAHAARGFALWRMKRNDEARREFEIAMRLDPKQFEARYFYGRLCFSEGQFEKAARLFEEASEVREDYQPDFFAGQSYAALGRAADAEAAYRRALHVVEKHMELNPDDARGATFRAVSLCRLGRMMEGLEWAERAVAIDPNDAGVCYNVACLYSLEGETEKAIDYLESVMDSGFGNWDWMAKDPDLDPLRSHLRFQALLAKYEQLAK